MRSPSAASLTGSAVRRAEDPGEKALAVRLHVLQHQQRRRQIARQLAEHPCQGVQAAGGGRERHDREGIRHGAARSWRGSRAG
jgi:hypothetical protein